MKTVYKGIIISVGIYIISLIVILGLLEISVAEERKDIVSIMTSSLVLWGIYMLIAYKLKLHVIFLILRSNHQIILGKITEIEYFKSPKSNGLYHITYTFNHNGERYEVKIHNRTKHHEKGDSVNVLYNDKFKINYLEDYLEDMFLDIIYLTGCAVAFLVLFYGFIRAYLMIK
jgi:hypothetical protein